MTSNNNLKIWQDAVSASKDCPSLEVLEKVMEVSSSDPKAAAHVAECPHCQAEITMLRSFESSVPLANEGAGVAWIAAQLEKQQKAPAAKVSLAAIPFWRSLFRVPYIAAAAALIIAITVGISLYRSDDGRPGFHNGNPNTNFRSVEVHLTKMNDLSQPPARLTWEAVPGAASYLVEVDDVTNDKLWEGKAIENFIPVDSALRAKMVPGKPLNWRVTALDASGQEMASGKDKFRVAP
jgi:hypothetical protein